MAGSVGPLNVTLSLSPRVDDPAYRAVTFDQVREAYEEQIRALEDLRDGLDSCIGCGCLSLKSCGVANPGDIMASSDEAPGATRLPAALRRPHLT